MLKTIVAYQDSEGEFLWESYLNDRIQKDKDFNPGGNRVMVEGSIS